MVCNPDVVVEETIVGRGHVVAADETDARVGGARRPESIGRLKLQVRAYDADDLAQWDLSFSR